MDREAHKSTSFEDANRWDKQQQWAMTPDERLQIINQTERVEKVVEEHVKAKEHYMDAAAQWKKSERILKDFIEELMLKLRSANIDLIRAGLKPYLFDKESDNGPAAPPPRKRRKVVDASDQ